jgi:hypothetical protein
LQKLGWDTTRLARVLDLPDASDEITLWRALKMLWTRGTTMSDVWDALMKKDAALYGEA